MAIRQSKYVDITSGVGGKAAVKDRELIARVFTTNSLCGIGHVYEFDDADAVMDYFGASSDEYKFAAKYFGFISKSVTKAKKISFFRWASTATNPYVKGLNIADTTLTKYSASNGKIGINVDGTVTQVTVDLASVASLSDVCTAVQTAVAAQFTGATCTIENSKVTLTLPATVTGQIFACSPLTTTEGQDDLATLLGLTNAVASNYSAGETPAEAASRSDSISDNYGSFLFLGGTALTDGENKAVAEWNATKNYKYLFCVAIQGYTDAQGGLVNETNINSLVAKGTGVGGIVGTCVWVCKSASDYILALPTALFATTDYGRANSTKTFMYQMNDSIEAAITNDSCANKLDAKFVNYMGITQSAGGLIQFAQDGFNMDGVDTAVYCNEVWMKSSFWTAIMNLFLAVEKIPANDDGAGMIKTVMMDTITTALKNGTITPRKDFTVVQKAYIGQILANPDAWKQVWADGYVLNISVVSENNKYVAKYVLVYSKGDAIRKVEGSDILI